MMSFSKEPKIAEQQMHAIIYYLTAFGYADGDFDAAERGFIRGFIARLVAGRADQAMPGRGRPAEGQSSSRSGPNTSTR
jgi:hypothetical protein